MATERNAVLAEHFSSEKNVSLFHATTIFFVHVCSKSTFTDIPGKIQKKRGGNYSSV